MFPDKSLQQNTKQRLLAALGNGSAQRPSVPDRFVRACASSGSHEGHIISSRFGAVDAFG
jgi:hypothetical protein